MAAKTLGKYTPNRKRLTILTRLREARNSVPAIIPGIFLKKGAGNARTAKTNKSIASMASHPRTIQTEKPGEKIELPATVISWPIKANTVPDNLAIRR